MGAEETKHQEASSGPRARDITGRDREARSLTTPPTARQIPPAGPAGPPTTAGVNSRNPKFLIFDLFTGMGGCWHALNSLKIPPGEASLIKMIMFETDKPARALLTAKAKDHLGWVQLSEESDSTGAKGSVLALTENNCALLRSILDENRTVEHVLFAGGSPCQGFSRASSNPKGVGDERSALIWVFHALPNAAEKHLGNKATVAVVL